MSSHLIKHFVDTAKAIECLVREYPTHAVSQLTLIYAAIDRFSWIGAPDNEASGGLFKAWVNQYMSNLVTSGCTADMLWGARCGLLHCGTAESRQTISNNVPQLWYSTGDHFNQTDDPTNFMTSVKWITNAFLAGAAQFILDIEANPTQLAIANGKVAKFLVLKD